MEYNTKLHYQGLKVQFAGKDFQQVLAYGNAVRGMLNKRRMRGNA